MTKASLQNKLQFVTTKGVGLELYFLYRKAAADPIQILRANLEGMHAQNKLEQVFINKIRNQFFGQDFEGKSLADAQEWVLKHIKDIDDLKNTYYYFPNKKSETEEYHIPVEFEEMVTLKDKLFENIDLFEFGKHLLDDVFAFLIRLQIDNEQVILFKQKYPIDVLSRSTVLKIIKHDTKFSLELDPLLKIGDKIDFMFIDNHFIILNLSLLESKYGFNEHYLKRGSESLEIIKSKKILVDTKKLDELVTKVSFSKKLMRVKADNEVLKTSIAAMRDFLNEYKTKDGKYSLSKRIKYLPGKNKFEVTTEIGAEDFLRLLNDQYLISKLTNRPFISDSQTEFQGEDEKVEGKAKRSKAKKEEVTT